MKKIRKSDFRGENEKERTKAAEDEKEVIIKGLAYWREFEEKYYVIEESRRVQIQIVNRGVAVFISWARQHAAEKKQKTNPMVLGCMAGSVLLRKAASYAFECKGRSTLTTDIIEQLGRSVEELFPVSRRD
ncbi:hypothetical protein CASFOL_029777 [Castilleja foliolosa]|uniref:Uncharacterized protein n=1 Tax=Castilleja foliolosa TaxID=1961234 RepID=A0ABD3C8V2_9LAMI